MVFSSYSITDARKQKVDFAGPYFVAHQDLLIRRNDEGLTGPENLDGKNLCSVDGHDVGRLRQGALHRQDPAPGVPAPSRSASTPWPRVRSTR